MNICEICGAEERNEQMEEESETFILHLCESCRNERMSTTHEWASPTE